MFLSNDLEAVLVQKMDGGKINPVQFSSRTMAAAERNYSACEREVLSLSHAEWS